MKYYKKLLFLSAASNSLHKTHFDQHKPYLTDNLMQCYFSMTAIVRVICQFFFYVYVDFISVF